MPSAVTTVFADDLTGACEIAGIAHRHGLRALVALTPGDVPPGTQILVVDTETRLSTPDDAAQSVAGWLNHSSIRERPGRIFKKIDSVLRGPIAAEVCKLAAYTGAQRILLVPGNPELGRVVRQGHCFINNVPLNKTAFASDPHSPVVSSSVIDLIGTVPGFESYALTARDGLPAAGLIIGNVESSNDVTRWAQRLPDDSLAVGSSVLFDALLSVTGRSLPRSSAAGIPDNRTLLLVSGTTDPAQRTLLRDLGSHGFNVIELRDFARQSLAETTTTLGAALRRRGHAALQAPTKLDSSSRSAHAIRQALATIARIAVDEHAVRHVVIEGGATAAAIAEDFGWQSFEVMYEWTPGVVTVMPNSSTDLLVTLKPGSYPWPSALLKLIQADRLTTQ